MRTLFVNLCLLLVSCVAGLLLCEISLRLFYPKYRDLAERRVHQDARRLWANRPNERNWHGHPDISFAHSLNHNNLALRQNRDFTRADLTSAANVGVFGDSYVENRRMAAPYSFTEPLDYLLNQSGRRFNVLNFGVDAYGTGQSFLHYADFRYAEDLDYVVYAYYAGNDIQDLYDNGLFDLDAAGRLVDHAPRPPSGCARLISRWHLSYLLLDGSARLFPLIGEYAATRERSEALEEQRRELRRHIRSNQERKTHGQAIFRQVLRRWKQMVESHGSVFYVMTLPQAPIDPSFAALLAEEEIEAIDLYECFGALDPAHKTREWRHSPYRFKHDGHWNEAGNRLAAVCLYRVLEEKTQSPALSEEDLRAALRGYYAAFEGSMSTNARGAPKPSLSAAVVGIREKYEALGPADPMWEEIKELVTTRSKRVLASDFDVYLDGRQLAYVKEACSPIDLQGEFFIDMVPVDENDLPKYRAHSGYARYREGVQSVVDQGRCLVRMRLPAYPIRYVQTGQFVFDAEGFVPLWEGGFAIDPDDSGEARGKFVPAARKRIIASDFEVYLDGGYLVYVKEECRPSDRKAKFFLHLKPVDKDALAQDRVQYGFDNLDFYDRGFKIDDSGCSMRRLLPPYAIRHIRTGQFAKDAEGGFLLLWEGEFSMERPAGVIEQQAGN